MIKIMKELKKKHIVLIPKLSFSETLWFKLNTTMNQREETIQVKVVNTGNPMNDTKYLSNTLHFNK